MLYANTPHTDPTGARLVRGDHYQNRMMGGSFVTSRVGVCRVVVLFLEGAGVFGVIFEPVTVTSTPSHIADVVVAFVVEFLEELSDDPIGVGVGFVGDGFTLDHHYVRYPFHVGNPPADPTQGVREHDRRVRCSHLPREAESGEIIYDTLSTTPAAHHARFG